MAVVAPIAFARDLGRTLSLLSRAARARRIYQPGNAALTRLLRDLAAGLEEALAQVEVIELRVRPGGLFYEDVLVLDAPNPDDSLAFAFYRDGIRRLTFHRGLRPDEVDVLVAAAASGFTYTGMGEDTVTYLWRHDLEHIRYLVVDTTIADASDLPDAASGDDARPASAKELDGAIDGLLRRIYGEGSEDVGITSLSVDRFDLPAKGIAEALDAVDEMAPGFHPPRHFSMSPAYGRELLTELEREDEHRVGLRAAHAVVHSARAQVSGTHECRRLFEVLLKMYDAAIIDENLRLGTFLLAGVARCPPTAERTSWLREALAETRLRQVAQNVAAGAHPDLPGLIAFFRAAGRSAVPIVLTVLPSFPEATDRRALADLVLELGVHSVDLVRDLIHAEQAFLAQDGMYILSRLGTPEAKAALSEAEYHPAAHIRIGLLENAKLLGEREGVELAARLLDDAEPRARVAAARTLARFPGRAVASVLEQRVHAPGFEDEPSEVKLALLAGYAVVCQGKALATLARFVKRGEGLFTGKRAEDTAAQAVRALRGIRGSPRALELLKRAATTRNRRVRDAAREVLKQMKEGR